MIIPCEGAGSRGEGLGSPLAGFQGRAGPEHRGRAARRRNWTGSGTSRRKIPLRLRRCRRTLPRRQAAFRSAVAPRTLTLISKVGHDRESHPGIGLRCLPLLGVLQQRPARDLGRWREHHPSHEGLAAGLRIRTPAPRRS